MIHTVSIIRRWLALAIFLLVGLAKVEAQYPANPQKPITYLNRAHSTQPGGLILFDDPVQFNAGVIGLSGTGLLTSGTSGPLYVDVTDWRAAFGQDTFLNWNGNAELTVNTSGSTGNVDGLIAHSGGTDGIPIVAWSQSGAPALLVTQDTAFDNPALAIYRSGTTGQTTDSPALLVQAGGETTGTNEVAQVGGCLALTGDNWDIFWGDGGLSLSGGLLDNTGKTHGFLALDPVHRQLVAEDGVTAVLTWTGTQAQVGNLVVTSSFSAPSAFTSQFLTASSGTGFATAAQGAKASSALQSGSSSAPGLTVTRSGTTFTLTGTATNALYLTGSSALNAANLSGTDANQVTFSNYIFSDGIYDTSGAGYTEQGPGGYVDLGGGGFIDQTGTGGFNGLTIKSPGSPLTTGTFIMPNGVAVTAPSSSGTLPLTTGSYAGFTSGTAQVLTPWQIVSTSATASQGGRYAVDTRGGAVSVTLPATPGNGWSDEFVDAGGTWATNNVTLVGNGSLIESSTSQFIFNTSRRTLAVFVGGTNGWELY